MVNGCQVLVVDTYLQVVGDEVGVEGTSLLWSRVYVRKFAGGEASAKSVATFFSKSFYPLSLNPLFVKLLYIYILMN